jgi:FAD:protein FMN transferase
MILVCPKRTYPLMILEGKKAHKKKAAIAAFFGALRAVVVPILLLAVGCTPQEESFLFEGEAQATTFHIKVYGPASVTAEDLQRWLADYNRVASPWDSNSLVSVLNKQALVAPDDAYLCELLQLGRTLYLLTDGALDPSLAPVIEAWGFGVGSATLAADDTVGLSRLMLHVGDTCWFDLARACTGNSAMKVVLDHVAKACPAGKTQLNFMSFSQGHSVDIVCDSLRAHGATAAFVEIGGEVRTFGKKLDGSSFKVGIEQPEQGKRADFAQTVTLNERALATSGNYRNFKVDPVTGQHYGHTLDAKTGWPIQTDVLSATMIGPKCALADGMATAAMAMGLHKTQEWIAKHPGWDAVLIYGDREKGLQIWSTLPSN